MRITVVKTAKRKKMMGKPKKIAIAVKLKKKRVTNVISRTKARDLMSKNKGHFFTATFIKKDGMRRVMSCTYLKDQTGSHLGYVKVKDTVLCRKTPTNCIRNVNLQTISDLHIAGKKYKIR